MFESKNMNYAFNIEHYKGLKNIDGTGVKFEKRIQSIENFVFPKEEVLSNWKKIKGYQGFVLETCYPGLLLGIGNAHGINTKSDIKCGFTFDYVTGLPYITGSTLKGTLRSYFPGEDKKSELYKEHEQLIRSLLGKDSLDVAGLEDHIFNYNDIFLGAFPVESQVKENKDMKNLMSLEYITPHNPEGMGSFKNPIPINLIKVKPEVPFEFSYVLNDYVIDGEVVVSATEKKQLFAKLITYMGIGAKTNVGFGKFADIETAHPNWEPSCIICGSRVGRDKKTGEPYKYCRDCGKLHKND